MNEHASNIDNIESPAENQCNSMPERGSCATQKVEEKVTVSPNMLRQLIEIKFIHKCNATNTVQCQPSKRIDGTSNYSTQRDVHNVDMRKFSRSVYNGMRRGITSHDMRRLSQKSKEHLY